MKVVLFCGGYGMRMRNTAATQCPSRCRWSAPGPCIWHVMHYYAHFGHKEFILCLGYGAEAHQGLLPDYQEAESNDFIMHAGQIELMHSDISDWSITFVDTGLESAIGERLRRVRRHLDGDEYFLANYADVLTDAPLDDMVAKFHESGAAASMIVVPPQSSFHCVDVAKRRGQGHHTGRPATDLGERWLLRLSATRSSTFSHRAAILSRMSAEPWRAKAGCSDTGTRASGSLPTPSRSERNSTRITTWHPSVDGVGAAASAVSES